MIPAPNEGRSASVDHEVPSQHLSGQRHVVSQLCSEPLQGPAQLFQAYNMLLKF